MEYSKLLRTTNGMYRRGKDEFWYQRDTMMLAVPISEILVGTGNMNGHVGKDNQYRRT